VLERLQTKTILGVKHVSNKGDYMFRFALHDGFYALGINPVDREYLTVNIHGQLYRLESVPMGWSLSPFYFCKMTITFDKLLHSLDPELPCPKPGHCRKTYLIRTRWRGARMLPYVDDLTTF
jgi:hypothetical protein